MHSAEVVTSAVLGCSATSADKERYRGTKSDFVVRFRTHLPFGLISRLKQKLKPAISMESILTDRRNGMGHLCATYLLIRYFESDLSSQSGTQSQHLNLCAVSGRRNNFSGARRRVENLCPL